MATELLPKRMRVPDGYGPPGPPRGGIGVYPNTLTLESVNQEIASRIDEGFDPLAAFLTVADGVRNWKAKEEETTDA